MMPIEMAGPIETIGLSSFVEAFAGMVEFAYERPTPFYAA